MSRVGLLLLVPSAMLLATLLVRGVLEAVPLPMAMAFLAVALV